MRFLYRRYWLWRRCWKLAVDKKSKMAVVRQATREMNLHDAWLIEKQLFGQYSIGYLTHGNYEVL